MPKTLTAPPRPLRLPPPRTRPIPLHDAEVTALRLNLFALFTFTMFALLLARLWYLQVYKGEAFRDAADSNRLRTVRQVAPRGVIEDSKGRVLVTNGAQFTVFILPSDLPKDKAEKQLILQRLAGILSLPWDDFQILMKRRDPGAGNPIPIAEGISEHTVAEIAENRMNLPGVLTDVEPVRRYPHTKLASHLLGYIGQISETELAKSENTDAGYQAGDFIGKTGVEREYNKYLNGEAGGTRFEVDAKGRRRKAVGDDPVVAGATLRLGMDEDVQRACEEALGSRKGAAVAVDPRDGRIIALVSNPGYDPTAFARRPLSSALYKSLNDQGAMYNRATMSAMPPGSTFKIVTSAAGLATGKIDAGTGDYCPGGISLGKHFKKCHSTHGYVNLTSALEASCDVFYYHAGFRIGPTLLADWSRKFGLGAKTGIDLPSETGGNVPSPDGKRKIAARYHSSDTEWHQGDTANMAIGQGSLQTTPLQMALVAAAIGNGGTVYKPYVVQAAIRPGDNTPVYKATPQVLQHLPLTPSQIAQIARGMRAVIVGHRGTSHVANLNGIEVAGKSGSAEVKTAGPTHAWFVCYAPLDKPTIAICVFLDADGKKLHGGADAAPVARKMMAAHFHVPDRVGNLGGGSLAD